MIRPFLSQLQPLSHLRMNERGAKKDVKEFIGTRPFR